MILAYQDIARRALYETVNSLTYLYGCILFITSATFNFSLLEHGDFPGRFALHLRVFSISIHIQRILMGPLPFQQRVRRLAFKGKSEKCWLKQENTCILLRIIFTRKNLYHVMHGFFKVVVVVRVMRHTLVVTLKLC